jgi:sugar phosphate isomerase/epimerase
LHTAGRLGADGVQIDLRQELPTAELSDTAVRQLRKLLDDLNLRVGSAAFPTRRGFAEPEDLERRIQATIDAMKGASRLGARVMLVGLGPLAPEGEPARSTLIEAVTTLAMNGNRLGVQLALQCPAAHPRDVTDLLAELPNGLVGLDLSPADLILSGRNPREVIKTLGQHVLHVFANDAAPGLGGMEGTSVELGRGTADFPELLGALEEYDYRGWITVERRNARQPAVDLENAMHYLRSL